MLELEIRDDIWHPFIYKQYNDIVWKRVIQDRIDGNGLMGGLDIDYTDLNVDPRANELVRELKSLQRTNPKIFSNLRSVLEPGAGSGAMTIHLYEYFRKNVFSSGFPQDFKHIGLELGNYSDDWYQQQEILEGAGFPLNGNSQFKDHYHLQKATNYLEFADNPENHKQFDAIFGISIYDLLAYHFGRKDLFEMTSKLLKPQGIFILFATPASSLGDNPREYGFELLQGNLEFDTVWQQL